MPILSRPTLARGRALVAVLATLSLTAALPALARAEAPTSAQLTALVDGRIPALSSVDDIAVSPDASRYAFVAWVRYAGFFADDAEVWVVDADGTDLVRVATLIPGSSSYAASFDNPKWWSDGSGFTFVRHASVAPRTSWVSIDLSTGVPVVVPNFTELAGGRFRAGPIDEASQVPPYAGGFWVQDVASGARLDATTVSWTVDGVRTVAWTDACRGAAAAGADPDGGLAAIEAQLTAATPGCRFDAWPAQKPSASEPGKSAELPAAAPALAPSAAPAGKGTPVALSATPVALATILSLRVTRRSARVTGLRMKVGAEKGTRLKVWLIDTSDGSRTLARGSFTIDAPTVAITLPIPRPAAKSAGATGAALQLRASATDGTGKRSLTVRSLAPLR